MVGSKLTALLKQAYCLSNSRMEALADTLRHAELPDNFIVGQLRPKVISPLMKRLQQLCRLLTAQLTLENHFVAR